MKKIGLIKIFQCMFLLFSCLITFLNKAEGASDLSPEQHLDELLDKGKLVDARQLIQGQLALYPEIDENVFTPLHSILDNFKDTRVTLIWTVGDFDQAEEVRSWLDAYKKRFIETLNFDQQNRLKWEDHLTLLDQTLSVSRRTLEDTDFIALKETFMDVNNDPLKLRDTLDAVNLLFITSCRSEAFRKNVTQEEIEIVKNMGESAMLQRMEVFQDGNQRYLEATQESEDATIVEQFKQDYLEYQNALSIYLSLINTQNPEKGIVDHLNLDLTILKNQEKEGTIPENMKSLLKIKDAESKEIYRLRKEIYNAAHAKGFLHYVFVTHTGCLSEHEFNDLIARYIETEGVLSL